MTQTPPAPEDTTQESESLRLLREDPDAFVRLLTEERVDWHRRATHEEILEKIRELTGN